MFYKLLMLNNRSERNIENRSLTMQKKTEYKTLKKVLQIRNSLLAQTGRATNRCPTCLFKQPPNLIGDRSRYHYTLYHKC